MVIDSGAEYIIEQLEKNGYEAYIVGGCVRDMLMDKKPYDWDICTQARPGKVKRIFSHAIDTGIKHGTVTVIYNELPYEVTTMRTEGVYKDNRHPENVSFVDDIETDLARRDFTVNAMAYNKKSGIVDIFGGREDIKNKLIKCVGKPDKRFCEDGLRIMRAIRFASVLDFAIEEKTSESIHKNRKLLQNIASERIQSELIKLLCGKNAESILEKYSEVISEIIPEEPLNYKISNIEAEPLLRTALLFSKMKAETVECVLKRLRFSKDFINTSVTLIRYSDYDISDKLLLKRLTGSIGVENVRMLLKLQEASGKELYNAHIFLNEIIENNECVSIKDLQINGNDLMSLGFSGKEVGVRLKKILNAVIEEKAENDRDSLISYAEKMN